MSRSAVGAGDLLVSEKLGLRWGVVLAVAAALAAVVLVVARQGGPAPSAITPSPNVTATSTPLAHLLPMTLSAVGPVRLLTQLWPPRCAAGAEAPATVRLASG